MSCMRIEIKKSIRSIRFAVSLGCMILFAVFSASYVIQNYILARDYVFPEQIEKGINDFYPIWNFFQNWIGAERLSVASSLFYTLMPVFAILPGALSFQREKKSGYLRVAMFRTGKWMYVLSKAIGVFLSGFFIVFVPLLVNTLIVSAFIPNTTPHVNYNFYIYVAFGDLWADLLFSVPWLYVALYTLLGAVMGGVLALFEFTVSFFTRHSIVAGLVPFFLCMSLDYISKIFVGLNTSYSGNLIFEISPLGLIRASHSGFPVNGWIVTSELVFLSSFSLLLIFSRGIKDEIF